MTIASAAPTTPSARGAVARWLFLIHQLPAKPAYPRVKLWRRLAALGAVPVKNAVYALPAGGEAREDFEWLVREIAAAGGDALVCEALLLDGISDEEIRAQFDAARGADYENLAAEIRAAAGSSTSEARAQIARWKTRLEQIAAIDFFGAPGQDVVDGLLAELENTMHETARRTATTPSPLLRDARGKVWVTRHGIKVDRMASAWLIRRFIDPDANFQFVVPEKHTHTEGAIRFDMFDAEFTHEGDACTFEVLLSATGLRDRGLRVIAEIVHDIDLKDGKFGREECAGIKSLIDGICAAAPDDMERLERGMRLFDDLYASLKDRRD